MPAHVIVRDLSKSYGPVAAVRGISFTVERGEIFGLLGPNGAGKTTTLECLIGLREPDGGGLEICGLDARRYPREVKQKIGVALQSTALPDAITPREALRLFGAFYRERAEPGPLLERFGLQGKADARCATLSGGERQRLALALAFVNRPAVVVLDEPTAGLDPSSRHELRSEIAGMKAEGHTVLLSTHDLDEAEELCDRIAVVDRGMVVATGTPHELIAQSGAAPTVTLVTTRPLASGQLASLPGVHDLRGDGAVARFQTTETTALLTALLPLLAAQRIEIVDLHVSKASLESVFLKLTRGPEERP
ncbi:MAG: ABC transporter ATP-binding protein [Opitutus sp.]|nr:ABC transporter ATP-binding protein [Opitutus sp.]